MLTDFSRTAAKAEELKITDQDLRDTAAMIRARQFIWSDKGSESRYYNIVRSFPEYFTNLFDAFGDELEINSSFGYVGVVPSAAHAQLRGLETYFLLILAKMHDGELRKGASDFGRTSPNAELLLTEYETLTGKTKPNETKTIDALRRLARFGVIRTGQITEHNKMVTITIMPSILKVVDKTFLESIEKSLITDSLDIDADIDSEQLNNLNEGEG